MNSLLLGASLLLILSLMLGLVRAFKGPSLSDRIMSIQLLGTGGVALLCLLSLALALPALLDTALILALLAVVTVIALTRQEANHD